MGDKTAATRERILDSALGLFNAEGTAAVSTNHVARAADLSVGNLYYHFKNKEEIIRALYERLARDTDVAFAVDPALPLGVADLERMLCANFAIQWRYRFFYREMLALLNRDPLLAGRYRAVRSRGFADFADLMTAFAAGGVFRPVADPAEVRRLAEACWLVSEFYVPFLEAGGETPDPERLEEGVALLRHVLKPYLPEESR
jgi:AcrR family transcriptional regulator